MQHHLFGPVASLSSSLGRGPSRFPRALLVHVHVRLVSSNRAQEACVPTYFRPTWPTRRLRGACEPAIVADVRVLCSSSSRNGLRRGDLVSPFIGRNASDCPINSFVSNPSSLPGKTGTNPERGGDGSSSSSVGGRKGERVGFGPACNRD